VSKRFAYDQAFDRNLGWLTDWEQQALRGKRVAIAGMGGVGGVHLLSLARLGIGAFNIADFDTFDIANFNRQIGATMATIGRPKVDVLAEMALAINPELHIRRFDAGVDPANMDDFLSGVDLFVDGFDFFTLDIRRKVFARCAELGIPAVTAAPIGMSAGYLAFVPGGMTFEQYFRFEGQPENEQYLRFLLGLTPRGLHRSYLVDPGRLDLAGRKGPSTIAACQLCAGVVAVMAIQLLLKRGDVKAAPYHHQFDAYRGRLAVSWLPFGNAGVLQRLRLALGRRMLAKRPAGVPVAAAPARTPVEEILNAARWAPSGDNEQPWRFEVTGEDSVVVHLAACTGQNVYEYRDGEPLLLSAGMLLESMRIAATAWGRRLDWRYEEDGQRILVSLVPARNVAKDPLYSSLTLRSVDRRPYRTRPLTGAEKSALESALGHGLTVEWHEDLKARWRIARLNAQATDIRLRTPEAFRVHQQVIDWQRAHSPDGIPAGAIGIDRLTQKVMRWSMQAWWRTRLLNALGGTLTGSVQMDYGPGLASAAFFALRQPRASSQGAGRVADLLGRGQSIQRFWLTATWLGLAIQPEMATLIFAHYGERSARFTTDPALCRKAEDLASSFRQVLGAGTDDFVFFGRIGEPRARLPLYRSTRRSLAQLTSSDGHK
jgi:nitroreductase